MTEMQYDRVAQLNGELQRLSNQRRKLLEKRRETQNKQNEYENVYNKTITIRRNFEEMIEESARLFKKNFCDDNVKVKKLNLLHENVRSVLYGSQMRETADDYTLVIAKAKQAYEECESHIACLNRDIQRIDGEIALLTRERSALCESGN